MTSTGRGLKRGDLVTVPAGPGLRRRAVVESVSADGLRFTDTAGGGTGRGTRRRCRWPWPEKLSGQLDM
jgi:hypothetical protein